MRNKVTVKTIPFENGDAPLVMDPFSSARIARPPKTQATEDYDSR